MIVQSLGATLVAKKDQLDKLKALVEGLDKAGFGSRFEGERSSMSGHARLPDDGLVVRCGQPPFQNGRLLHEACKQNFKAISGSRSSAERAWRLRSLLFGVPTIR